MGRGTSQASNPDGANDELFGEAYEKSRTRSSAAHQDFVSEESALPNLHDIFKPEDVAPPEVGHQPVSPQLAFAPVGSSCCSDSRDCCHSSICHTTAYIWGQQI